MSNLNTEDIAAYLENNEPLNQINNDDISLDLYHWSKLITELSVKERELFRRKKDYQEHVDNVIESTDFKALYGRNNDSLRKKHVQKVLRDEYMCIKELEFSIEFLKRRISFLKQLVHTKTVLMEVKE